jgi:hypothetical protein
MFQKRDRRTSIRMSLGGCMIDQAHGAKPFTTDPRRHSITPRGKGSRNIRQAILIAGELPVRGLHSMAPEGLRTKSTPEPEKAPRERG